MSKEKKVFIKVLETDGLKAALESERTVNSIVTRLKPYLATYKIIHLDDFEIKAGVKSFDSLKETIEGFINEH